jgi:hypothetical protein
MADLLGKDQPIDQNDQITILDDLALCEFRGDSRSDEDPDTAALEASDHPGDLVRRDRGVREHALGLPKDDQLGDRRP